MLLCLILASFSLTSPSEQELEAPEVPPIEKEQEEGNPAELDLEALLELESLESALDDVEDEEAPPLIVEDSWLSGEPFVQIRGGLWNHPSFETMTTLGGRTIKSETIPNVGLDVVYKGKGWFFYPSFDYGQGDGLTLMTYGIHAGVSGRIPRALSPIPISVRFSVGMISGLLDVSESEFGSFENGVGYQVRLAFVTRLSKENGISLWADLRDIEFDYEGTVLQGDTEAIGASFAFGGSFEVNF